MLKPLIHRPRSALRAFVQTESAGGVVLMVAAAFALVVANSPLAANYFAALKTNVGPLSALHWINDGLMAIFFLLVGLEVKRELLDGQLSTWDRRVLPGAAAAGGMLAPALIFVAFNLGTPETLRGWAIPAATDIAFALGVLALIGKRVPASLKVFLTAVAIIDDLGAIIIIALFYTAQLNVTALFGALALLALLAALNRFRVRRLAPYLVIGAGVWVLMLLSGVHATLAGVAVAMTIPLTPAPAHTDDEESPLHRLEHAIAGWVVEEDLHAASAGDDVGRILDPSSREPRLVGGRVGAGEGDVVEGGLCRNVALLVGLCFGEVKHVLCACVEPVAEARERGPLADG